MNTQKTLMAIYDVYPTLYEKEKQVAEYIIAHPREVTEMNVTELAEKSNVSVATVVRFSKKVGFQGYYHLKIMLEKESVDIERSFLLSLKSNSVKADVREIFEYKIAELRETMEAIDGYEVEQCISLIRGCDTLFIFAAGNTNPVAKYAAFQFGLAGIRAICNTTLEAQINSAYLMKSTDVALGITYSGTTNMMLDIFSVAKKQHIPSICITSYVNSPVAQLCNHKLKFLSKERAFFEAFSSTKMNAMAVVDMLVLLVSQDREHNKLPYNSEREEILAKYKT